jgi:hypothetical protein
MCKHKFVYYYSSKRASRIWEYGWIYTFVKIDYFYCEKCLDTKEIRRECTQHEATGPEWFESDDISERVEWRKKTSRRLIFINYQKI